jgi:hypothetical protein
VYKSKFGYFFPSILYSKTPASGPEAIQIPMAVPVKFSVNSLPTSVETRAGISTYCFLVETPSFGFQASSIFQFTSDFAFITSK